MKQVVLEPSTNTHRISAKKVAVKDHGDGIMDLDVQGDGIVTHGEHGTLKTESSKVFKFVQKEFNPVTKKLRNAYD